MINFLDNITKSYIIRFSMRRIVKIKSKTRIYEVQKKLKITFNQKKTKTYLIQTLVPAEELEKRKINKKEEQKMVEKNKIIRMAILKLT